MNPPWAVRLATVWVLLWLGFADAAWGGEAGEIAYWALGDSYTAGVGVREKETFPVQLEQQLKVSGFPVILEANLARGGAGIQDVLDRQWPMIREKPMGLVTILVGVNDWVRSTGARRFRSRLRRLLNEMVPRLPSSQRVILFTLPDFSCAPSGDRFGFGKSAPNGMKRFGKMIGEIAEEFQVTLIDLFPLSQEACKNSAHFVEDGFHPSGSQYALWVEHFLPEIRGVLKPERGGEN